jgi:hypothetical protein
MKRISLPPGLQAALFFAVVLVGIRLATLVTGTDFSLRGDFFATLPGAYVQALNPRLWNSEDLRLSWGFHRPYYFYGPTQYLTLYPMALLNSYKQIAVALSFVYAAVLGAAIYVLSRLAGEAGAARPWAVFVLSMAFAPLLQAYFHFEFEVVVFFVIVTAMWLLVLRRDRLAGALIGYITWFKIWPLIFLGYFILRRQWKAVGAFVLASVLTLGVSHALFGLDRFVILNPSLARSIPGRDFFTTTLIPPLDVGFESKLGPENATGQGFCKGWVRSDETYVSARWGMCGLIFTHQWPAGVAVFYVTGASLAALFLIGFLAADARRELSQADRACRIVCEMSLLIIGSALMLIAHFYYFLFLLTPICVLASRFIARAAWVKLGWLAVAGAVLGGLIMPALLVSRLLGRSFWAFYSGHSVYLIGLSMLTGLIMWEYLSLGFSSRDLTLDTRENP